MARTNSLHDGEMGRGRHNDSSSSRETSPQPKQKRSFTPTSDDGDLVVPPIADDDTPPPPERPIIRQAVGFSWDASTSINTAPTNINTYEASFPPKPTPYGAFFLPGQEVPVAPQPPPPKRKGAGSSKTRKDGGSAKKVRHFNDEFSSQTGSFRLRAYTPTAALVPPMQHGSGPYSSLYRATSDARDHGDLAVLGAPAVASTYSGDASGNGHSVASAFPPEIPTGQSSVHNLLHHSAPSSSTKKAKVSGSKVKSKAKAKTSGTSNPVPSSTSRVSSNVKASTFTSTMDRASSSQAPSPRRPPSAVPQAGTPLTTDATASPGGTSYYRRDYEMGIHGSDPSHYSPSTSATRSFSPQPRSSFHPVSPVPTAVPPVQHQHANADPNPSAEAQQVSFQGAWTADAHDPARRIVRQVRMLTILIQDIRSGTTDHQLAEVKVPLRVADDPADGYWADAKEICEKLQSGPSRIDGPAKVYTLRGKYRQFFLRVSAENKDDCIPANIIVSPQRTLDVVVEENPPPGTLPLPPNIPRDLRGTPTPEYDSPPPPSQSTTLRSEYIRGSNTSDAITEQFTRKRRHSSSFDDYDADYTSGAYRHGSPSTLTSTHNPTPNGSPSRTVSPSYLYQSVPTNAPKKRKNYVDTSQDHITSDEYRETRHLPPGHHIGYESPESDAEQEQVDDLISKALSPSLEEDPSWVEIFMSRAKPAIVKEVLKQYGIVQRMIDKWVGKRIFRSSRHTIQKSHVLTALRLDLKWGSACTETLELLKLYGPDGKRQTDPRVIEMIDNQETPQRNEQPIKRLLRLLKEIDLDWVKKHPADAPTSATGRSAMRKEREQETPNPQSGHRTSWTR